MLISIADLFKKYNIHPKGVLHVGASSGQECAEYYKQGIKHTLWIEALSDVFEKLEKHIAPYPDALAIQACISNVDGEEVIFNVANNEGQSSSFLDFGTHSKEHPTVKFIRQVTMTTRTLKTIIEFFKVDMGKYDMLNIDLQGAELKALEGLGEYLNGFTSLYLEVNRAELYRGCPMVEEIDEYVKQFGFTRVETKWTGAGWGDGFYIKK